MSAPTRITAEPGHLYLMKDGQRTVVEGGTAHTVAWRYDHQPAAGISARSVFESWIESVLE